MPRQRPFKEYIDHQHKIKELYLHKVQADSIQNSEYNPVIAECYDDLAIICRYLGDLEAYHSYLDASICYSKHLHYGGDVVSDTSSEIWTLPADEPGSVGKVSLNTSIRLSLAGKFPEMAGKLLESVVSRCDISVESNTLLNGRYSLDKKAYAGLWKGYALVCLKRYEEACHHLHSVVPIYRALKVNSCHDGDVNAVIEYALSKALVPLCAFMRNPVKQNLINAQTGLEEFPASIYDNFLRMRAYTYYYHIRDLFHDVYNRDPSDLPTIIPGIIEPPPKPYLVRLAKENNFSGSIYIRDPEILLRKEYLCNNRDFRKFINYVSSLKDYPAVTSLIDIYTTGQCMDANPVASDCERLTALSGADPGILTIANRIGSYAREAASKGSVIVLDYDCYTKTESLLYHFPKIPGTGKTISLSARRGLATVPSRAHSITHEYAKSGRIILGLQDVDDPGIELAGYLSESPEYSALIRARDIKLEQGSFGLFQKDHDRNKLQYRISQENADITAFKRNTRRLLLQMEKMPFNTERLRKVKLLIESAKFSQAYDLLNESDLHSDQTSFLEARLSGCMNSNDINAGLMRNAYEFFLKAMLADLTFTIPNDCDRDRFFQHALTSYGNNPEILFEYAFWCQRTFSGNEPEGAYLEFRKKFERGFIGRHSEYYAIILHNLGVMYLDTQDIERSELYFDEAKKFFTSHVGENPSTFFPFFAAVLSNMSILSILKTELDDARTLAEEARDQYIMCAASDPYKYLPEVARMKMRIIDIDYTYNKFNFSDMENDDIVAICLTFAEHDPERYLPFYKEALEAQRREVAGTLASQSWSNAPHVITSCKSQITEIDAILGEL